MLFLLEHFSYEKLHKRKFNFHENISSWRKQNTRIFAWSSHIVNKKYFLHQKWICITFSCRQFHKKTCLHSGALWTDMHLYEQSIDVIDLLLILWLFFCLVNEIYCSIKCIQLSMHNQLITEWISVLKKFIDYNSGLHSIPKGLETRMRLEIFFYLILFFVCCLQDILFTRNIYKT